MRTPRVVKRTLTVEWERQPEATAYRLETVVVAIDAFGHESRPSLPACVVHDARWHSVGEPHAD